MRTEMEVLTPWVESNDAWTPVTFTQYGGKYADVTGQNAVNIPPQPNLVAVRYWCPDDRLAELEADANFYILFYIGQQDDVMPPSEFGSLRAYLGQQGVDQEDITLAIGGTAGGRSRTEIVNDLKSWLRTLNRP